jgi:hypothetical protein
MVKDLQIQKIVVPLPRITILKQKNMETTVKKTRSKKVAAMDAAIQKMIMEGKPLSPIAKYWLEEDPNDWQIIDMRAVLR